MIYLGIFGVSFLAGSFLPLASELWVLAYAKSLPSPTLLVLSASVGNTLGGLSCYAIAYYGGEKLLKKVFGWSDHKISTWRLRCQNYHPSTLALLCWLPFAGELIAASLGVLKSPILKVSIFMFLGKSLRYAILVYGAL